MLLGRKCKLFIFKLFFEVKDDRKCIIIIKVYNPMYNTKGEGAPTTH